MWEFIEQNPFIIGALTGSLATYLLGLLVDYLRREKKAIGYSISSRKIIERGKQGLEIKYKDVLIDCLCSHQISIRNVGNRALKDLPVRITCSDGKIFETDLKSPEGSNYEITQEGSNTIIVKCDLLNVGEVINLGLTTADNANGAISVIARAENLSVKQISQDARFLELLELVADQFVMTRLALDVTKLIMK